MFFGGSRRHGYAPSLHRTRATWTSSNYLQQIAYSKISVHSGIVLFRTFTLLEQNVRSVRRETGNERPVLETRFWTFSGAPFRQIDSLSPRILALLILMAIVYGYLYLFFYHHHGSAWRPPCLLSRVTPDLGISALVSNLLLAWLPLTYHLISS